MATPEEPVAASILERAEKDSEAHDWLAIPADLRIIDDETLDWIADIPHLEELDQENMEPEPKGAKCGVSSPIASVKDRRFVDLTNSP